jgi:hypothetical protein
VTELPPGPATMGSSNSTPAVDGSSRDLLGRWGDLAGGDRVEVVRAGLPVESGVVDQVMSDGSVVWLWMDDGRGRTMLLAGDGLCLRRTEPNIRDLR